MKTPNAPICLRNPLDQQLGPIVARLWMLPRGATSAAMDAITDEPFSPEQALRQLQALEAGEAALDAELDASLSAGQSSADSFVLLH